MRNWTIIISDRNSIKSCGHCQKSYTTVAWQKKKIEHVKHRLRKYLHFARCVRYSWYSFLSVWPCTTALSADGDFDDNTSNKINLSNRLLVKSIFCYDRERMGRKWKKSGRNLKIEKKHRLCKKQRGSRSKKRERDSKWEKETETSCPCGTMW